MLFLNKKKMIYPTYTIIPQMMAIIMSLIAFSGEKLNSSAAWGRYKNKHMYFFVFLAFRAKAVKVMLFPSLSVHIKCAHGSAVSSCLYFVSVYNAH